MTAIDFDKKRKKFYHLVMFPYPSGDLHIGHWYNYAPADIYARKKKMEGLNLLFPIGFDAFGLPAENAAIKSGVDPATWTDKNIKKMRGQLRSINATFDWSREVITSDPEYYKWTQWLFLQLYKKGLAYKKKAPANWCPKDQTVLANEQVVDGCCERCGTKVVQKLIDQWLFKITDYADRLLNDLEKLDWPERTKNAQRNWIGKSEGLLFSAPVKDTKLTVETFSAHFQACYADTFVVIAPDHPFLEKLVKGIKDEKKVLDFAQRLVEKRIKQGFQDDKEIEGIFTGRYIVDPLGNGNLPIWVASYALADYGTGIVKCSAHDERDFAFAKKYGIKLKAVLMPTDSNLRAQVEALEVCYSDMQNGILTEPAEMAGKTGKQATEGIIDHLVAKGFSKRKTTYRLRDWLVSRQRYWGVPIPIVYCDKCGTQPVKDANLPVELPKIKDYLPKGIPPLATAANWVKTTCPNCDGPAAREVETMDTFVDSAWYFLRYTDPDNKKEFANAEKMKYWCPVDLYIGGAEHTVLHLLYSRFIVKALHDLGKIEFEEPFTKLRHQGIILGPDHHKMSKSRGNVVDPDAIVSKHGEDSVRMYLAFMGPYEQGGPWSDDGLFGVIRYINRVAKIKPTKSSTATKKLLHKTIKKVGEDINDLKFNTAIAAMMTFQNAIDDEGIGPQELEKYIKILSPFAPHLCGELWLKYGYKDSIHEQSWPEYDKDLVADEIVIIAVQINGKTKGTVEAKPDANQKEVELLAKKYSQERAKKVIYVPGKVINFVLE